MGNKELSYLQWLSLWGNRENGSPAPTLHPHFFTGCFRVFLDPLRATNSSSNSRGTRCSLPTSVSLPSRAARTQCSKRLFGNDRCLAALPSRRACHLDQLDRLRPKLRRVKPLRYPFPLRPPYSQNTRPVGLHFPQPTSILGVHFFGEEPVHKQPNSC